MSTTYKDDLREVLNLGYKGLAVTESVWQNENPVKRFMELKTVYESLINKP